MAHTPTPWFTSDDAVMAAPYGEDVVVATCEERTCTGDNGLAEACDNARLIVIAVNSHEAMREALERALPYVELAYGEEGGEEAAEAKRDLDFCRAALSKARAARAEG